MPSGFAEAMSACSATALHQDLEVALDQIAVQRSDRPTCPIVDRPTVIEVDALGVESSVTAVRIENERGAGAASTQSGPAIFRLRFSWAWRSAHGWMKLSSFVSAMTLYLISARSTP